jgi:DegV family protein with EDD domain
MKISITADSTCDIPQGIREKNDIEIIPFGVMLGEELRRDGMDVEPQDLYDYVEKTKELPKTSAINEIEYQELFERKLKQCDVLIHFCLSSEISSAYSNAKRASEKFENVYVVDTKSLSSGSGLLVLSCVDKINEGKDLDTILREINEEIPKVQASFLIDTLKYLHKGGRCSGVAKLAATLLFLKPRISLVDGKMEVTKKYMGGISGCLVKYCKDMLDEVKPNKKRVFVTYSSPVDPAREIIVQKLKDEGFEEIIECSACSTICTHCGPKTLGVLYIAE